jgi:hypothetical protein
VVPDFNQQRPEFQHPYIRLGDSGANIHSSETIKSLESSPHGSKLLIIDTPFDSDLGLPPTFSQAVQMSSSVQLGAIHSILEAQEAETDDGFRKPSPSPTRSVTEELSRPASPSTEDAAHAAPDAVVSEEQLPPADGGRQAWGFLAAAFILEMIIWGGWFSLNRASPKLKSGFLLKGFPNSYGVLLAYYMKRPIGQKSGAGNILPAVGTISSGLIYCSGRGWRFRYRAATHAVFNKVHLLFSGSTGVPRSGVRSCGRAQCAALLACWEPALQKV